MNYLMTNRTFHGPNFFLQSLEPMLWNADSKLRKLDKIFFLILFKISQNQILNHSFRDVI